MRKSILPPRTDGHKYASFPSLCTLSFSSLPSLSFLVILLFSLSPSEKETSREQARENEIKREMGQGIKRKGRKALRTKMEGEGGNGKEQEEREKRESEERAQELGFGG